MHGKFPWSTGTIADIREYKLGIISKKYMRQPKKPVSKPHAVVLAATTVFPCHKGMIRRNAFGGELLGLRTG